MKIEMVGLGTVQEHPKNARLHNVDLIQRSLAEFGQYQPIVVQTSTGFVIAGNGRLQAARALGWDKIAAVKVDVDDERAAAMLLVDNRTSDLATYDPEALAELLGAVPDLDVAGYTDRDLSDLLFKMKPPDNFPTLDVEGEEFLHACPKCGFQFDG